MAEKSRNPIAKALSVLTYVADSKSLKVGVRELAAAMDMTPASTHRILTALTESGYISQDPIDQRYALGVAFFRVAQLSVAKAPVRQASLRAMGPLVEACNETAFLGFYEPSLQEMMLTASVESQHPFRYAVELNKWRSVHAGASGLAIMAFLSEREIEQIIERTHLSPFTPKTITNPAVLKRELNAIRKRGYAFTRGQRIPDAVGIAAPIINPSGRVLGDICLIIPEQRYDESSRERLAQRLLDSVAQVRAEIGAAPPPTA